MALHPRRASPGGPRARAAGDGLVVPEGVIAEREVVHAPLRVGASFERGEADVGDALRGEHVSAHNRRALRGGQETSRRDGDANGRQASLVQGNLLVDQTPDAVNHRRARHRGGRVPVPDNLVARPGKVENSAALFPIKRQRQTYNASVVHLVLRGQDNLVGITRDGPEATRESFSSLSEHVPDRQLRVVPHVAHVVRHRRLAVRIHELVDERDAPPVSRHLRVQVAQVIGQLTRSRGSVGARFREQVRDTLQIVPSGDHELERLDGGALVGD